VDSLPPGQADSPAVDPASKPGDSSQEEEKRGEWLAAPIPISSPAIGSGLAWGVGYVFPFNKKDKISPDSVIGVGGLFTNNGSYGIAGGGKLYLKQDRYRFTIAGGDANINADVYGVGKPAGDRGVSLPLTFNGYAFISEALFSPWKNIYVGARFQYRNLSISLDEEKMDPSDIEDPPEGLEDIIGELQGELGQQQTVAIGPRFQWDTRDNKYYPRRGILLDSGADFFGESIGSKFTYQYYKVAFNKYSGLGQYQVIAFRGMACAAAGDHIPIYDLCLFGVSNDLRGYTAGRYQDKRMFATQAEYRLSMPKQGFWGRFGIVAFGGFGGVAEKFGDIEFDDLLPAGGGGIRFRLTKKNLINFRADYGVGRGGNTFSMGVGEAF
jgi:outer membrane protein assembly factor BamA